MVGYFEKNLSLLCEIKAAGIDQIEGENVSVDELLQDVRAILKVIQSRET